jgi:hypothetical protein
MLVHLFHALTALPLWACDGIVGGLFAVGGIVLLVFGKNKLARMHLVPQATVETMNMKENMQWIKEQVRANGTSWSTIWNWPRRQMSRFVWPLGIGQSGRVSPEVANMDCLDRAGLFGAARDAPAVHEHAGAS